MKRYLAIISVLFLMSCNKEYFPEEEAYRDPNLIGTWISLFQLRNNASPTVLVFLNSGYCGETTDISKNGNFESVDGIWYVEKMDDNSELKYNKIHKKKRFRHGRYNHQVDYYFSEKNDTLFCHYTSYEAGKWDTMMKYKYQLIFDGPEYVGIDSIK